MKRYFAFFIFTAMICFASTGVVVSENDKARARELVEQMTLEEKIAYLSGEFEIMAGDTSENLPLKGVLTL